MASLPIRSASCDIRRARKSDAADIARLFLISSDGLAAYIWSKHQAPGMSLEEVGTARYAREQTIFSYENCVMAEQDGKIAGMMHFFAETGPPREITDDDPVLRPYLELELHGSLYVSGIAVYERYRGTGIGTDLLRYALAQAKEQGHGKVSLICFERNTGAMRLYRRLGFSEIDRRAIVPHPMLHYREGDAILMARGVEDV
jgi:ribosomal protein S18 acetylase RimI-like enzyme